MSVLIKGETMPSVCWGCPLCYDDYHCTGLEKSIDTNIYKEKLPDCPLIELPPHGDLIDRDALIAVENRTRTYYPESGDESLIRHYILDYITLEQVKTAPTILEAEVEET